MRRSLVRPRHLPLGVSALAVLAMLAGCNYPAQLVWSPDGSRAAYRVGTDAYLIESTGSVVQKLGTSMGGFAWSADGRRLYYALLREQDGDDDDGGDNDVPPPRTPVRRDWFAGPKPPFALAPEAATAEVCVAENGRSRVLCRLPGTALHASLSPDEAWLAVLVARECEEPDDARDSDDGRTDEDEDEDGDESSESETSSAAELYVLSLRSGRVYLLGYPAFVGVTFTAPGRLAYVARRGGRWQDEPRAAKLVEVALDPARRRLKREQPYGNVGFPVWMRPLPDGDLLILSVSRADAKAAAAKDDDAQPPVTLYRFERGRGKLRVVADSLAPLLSVSPDGRRLLAERVNPPAEPKGQDIHELVLMNSDGGHVRVVRRMEHDWFTLWPSWRDADHFLLASAEPLGPEDAAGTTRYNVEEYRADLDGRSRHVRTLSATWDTDMLPHVQNSKFLKKIPAVTQPSTQPAAP